MLDQRELPRLQREDICRLSELHYVRSYAGPCSRKNVCHRFPLAFAQDGIEGML
jgi:hypothetical protein